MNRHEAIKRGIQKSINIKPSKKGSFTRIAKKHGRTVRKEAEEDRGKPGVLGKKARFALFAERIAAHRKRK